MTASKNKNLQFTSSFGLLEKSYQLVLDNWKLFALLYALPFVSVLSTAMSAQNKSNSSSDKGFLLDVFAGEGVFATVIGKSLLLILLFVVISILIELLLIGLELKVAQGKNPSFDEVWKLISSRFSDLFILNLLVGLIVIAGLILFIVPGLIFLRWYLLSPYFLLDRNLSVTEAMRKSKQASQKYSRELWGVIGVYALFVLPGFFSGIWLFLSFVLTTMYSVAAAIRYQEIKKAN